MATRSISLSGLINEFNITREKILNIFYNVLNEVSNEYYSQKLEKLFLFGLDNIDLFINIRVQSTLNPSQQIHYYIEKWVTNYVKDRDNIKLLTPLKTYGERDEALISRVRASTRAEEEILKNYIDGHYLFMSAENMNGAILEEYLAEILEPHGWLWCAGSVYRAIDFCYLGEEVKLLQVKNKYNTENSSSSAIRIGTTIQKWNRLSRPRVSTGLFNPTPNWEELRRIVNIPSVDNLLTEESYLNFIETNSTNELDRL